MEASSSSPVASSPSAAQVLSPPRFPFSELFCSSSSPILLPPARFQVRGLNIFLCRSKNELKTGFCTAVFFLFKELFSVLSFGFLALWHRPSPPCKSKFIPSSRFFFDFFPADKKKEVFRFLFLSRCSIYSAE
jgi:hypothetical protein